MSTEDSLFSAIARGEGQTVEAIISQYPDILVAAPPLRLYESWLELAIIQAALKADNAYLAGNIDAVAVVLFTQIKQRLLAVPSDADKLLKGRNPLYLACKHGRDFVVRAFLLDGVNVESRCSNDEESPAVWAFNYMQQYNAVQRYNKTSVHNDQLYKAVPCAQLIIAKYSELHPQQDIKSQSDNQQKPPQGINADARKWVNGLLLAKLSCVVVGIYFCKILYEWCYPEKNSDEVHSDEHELGYSETIDELV